MVDAAAREVWGTFSVKDHVRERTFVDELMLYDRLVIPVPPRGNDKELQRWEGNDWQPARLLECLRRLEDLAVPVKWDEPQQAQYEEDDRLQAARQLDPLYATSLHWALQFSLGVPPELIPKGVEQVRPIAAYPSPEEFARAHTIRVFRAPDDVTRERLVAVLARKFLVLEPSRIDAMRQLENAVDLAKRGDFREKRSRFHEWLEGKIVTGMAEGDVVGEMQRHIDEINNAAARANHRLIFKSAFLVTKVGLNAAPAALAYLGIPAPPAKDLGLGNAAVVVAENVLDKGLPELPVSPANPAAMFVTAGEELRRRELERLFEFG
jgi:hypothetical protein